MSEASLTYVYLFEYGSYLGWLIGLVLLITKFKDQRILQWTFISMTLLFPFEWYADMYWMYINYDSQFTPMMGHFPLFIPFAWGWFFALVLGVCLSQKDKLEAMGPAKSTTVILVAFVIWDIAVEGFGTNTGLWVYWWSEESFIPGTKLPIWIPMLTALQTPAYYFSALWAEKRYANASWSSGFITYLTTTLLGSIILAVVGKIWVDTIVGHDPAPFAPQWWLDGSFPVF